MKKFLFLIFSALILSLGADERTVTDIQLERDRIFNQLLELRKAYILKDPKLNELHKKIIDLHIELAHQLDEKEDIRTLNNQLIRLDRELRNMRRRR